MQTQKGNDRRGIIFSHSHLILQAEFPDFDLSRTTAGALRSFAATHQRPSETLIKKERKRKVMFDFLICKSFASHWQYVIDFGHFA